MGSFLNGHVLKFVTAKAKKKNPKVMLDIRTINRMCIETTILLSCICNGYNLEILVHN